MKRIVYFLFLVTGQLFSQNIEIILDTAFAEPSFYQKKYGRHKTGIMGGEGFELNMSSKLKHAFYGDRPGNPYYNCGSWTILNDSIVLFISNKKLLKKYGYSSRESYRPFSISWDLKTDLKNNENKLLVFKNELVVLNDTMSLDELLNQFRDIIELKLGNLKASIDHEDPYFYFQLNEKIANEFYDILYKNDIFASLNTLRSFE